MKTTKSKFRSAALFVAIATATAALLVSCSGAPDISFSTNIKAVAIISLAGNGEATIDWGDGSAVQTVPLTPVEGGYTRIEHIYEAEGMKNVAINGDIVKFVVDDYLPMTSLNVSKITGLTDLHCPYCELTTLDVSKNTALTYLNCSDNKLTSLDVSKNTTLTDLRCNFNNLASLDVSKNTMLTDLDLYDNPGDEAGDFHVTVWPNGLPGRRIDLDFTTTPWKHYDGSSVVTPHYHAR